MLIINLLSVPWRIKSRFIILDSKVLHNWGPALTILPSLNTCLPQSSHFYFCNISKTFPLSRLCISSFHCLPYLHLDNSLSLKRAFPDPVNVQYISQYFSLADGLTYFQFLFLHLLLECKLLENSDFLCLVHGFILSALKSALSKCPTYMC